MPAADRATAIEYTCIETSTCVCCAPGVLHPHLSIMFCSCTATSQAVSNTRGMSTCKSLLISMHAYRYIQSFNWVVYSTTSCSYCKQWHDVSVLLFALQHSHPARTHLPAAQPSANLADILSKAFLTARQYRAAARAAALDHQQLQEAGVSTRIYWTAQSPTAVEDHRWVPLLWFIMKHSELT